MSTTGMKRVTKTAMGVAAVGVATSVVGVAATQPDLLSAPLVDLAALIVVGSSTHPDGSGNENFFQGKFNATPYNTTGTDITHVNFFTGPLGINQALQANAGEQNAILSSGWGAANASLLLMQLQAQHDPTLPQTVFVLDNNVARPDGGFGTRYPWFALIGVNPFPSPTDTDAAAVVDIGYAYDYNSNAPSDVWNVVADVNSLVAYLYRHLNQDQLDLPVNVDGSPKDTCGSANTCGITDNGQVLECSDAQCGEVPAGDRVAAYVTKRGNTTYVTYTSNGLPLTNLIRDVVPVFGNFIADLTEPLLTVLVNSAYPGGNPIPADPSKYEPARLFPPPAEIVATATKIPGAIQQGLEAVTGGGSTASTTSTTTLTAEAVSTDEGVPASTDKDAEVPDKDKPKPLTNVVRDSEKAVPQQVGEQKTSGRESETVGTTSTSTATPIPTPKPTTENTPSTESSTGSAGTGGPTVNETSGAAA
jgi:PE-PPE domain